MIRIIARIKKNWQEAEVYLPRLNAKPLCCGYERRSLKGCDADAAT
jgi:hypothetical protein